MFDCPKELKDSTRVSTLGSIPVGDQALQHSSTPGLQYTNTPILQHSSTQALQSSSTPRLHPSILRSSSQLLGSALINSLPSKKDLVSNHLKRLLSWGMLTSSLEPGQ
jgi:hypothetical protein